MFMQAVKKRFVAGSLCCRLVQDNDIEAFKGRTMVSKRFPGYSLQAVAVDREPAFFFGYGQTEPCFLRAVFSV